MYPMNCIPVADAADAGDAGDAAAAAADAGVVRMARREARRPSVCFGPWRTRNPRVSLCNDDTLAALRRNFFVFLCNHCNFF